MKFKERKDKIKLPSIDERDLEKIKFDSKMDSNYYGDLLEARRIIAEYSNVLADADKNDSARRAMRKPH